MKPHRRQQETTQQHMIDMEVLAEDLLTDQQQVSSINIIINDIIDFIKKNITCCVISDYQPRSPS